MFDYEKRREVFYNPITNKNDSDVKYTRHRNIGNSETHWMPPGLKFADIRKNRTQGYEVVPAHDGEGLVWVASSTLPDEVE